MRNINEILKLLASDLNMDYCRHFDRIKSALEYCNGHIKPFDKIHFRGGNETVINDIVSKIEEDIVGLNDKENEQDLRKITFFLILNTDATFTYDLKSDQHICHILNITPQLPKCLLLPILWELKLHKFFYECISYTPCWFSIQFIDAAVASMKFLEPYDVLDKIENLIKAIFTNICRSDFRQIDIVTKKIILSKFYDHSMELLRQFYTPDIEKFSEWSKREFFKYSGFAIRHILKMVLYCFDCLEVPVSKKLEEKHGIYEICKEVCLKNEKLENGYSEEVCESLNKILMTLLNTLQYNVMLVTLDVFMEWVEIDVNSDLTLQADIGGYAYQVLSRMATNKSFGHEVENHLKFIAIEPKTLEDTIKEANIGDILRKIESEELDKKQRQLWLGELLSRPIILGNDECLETISTNAALLTFDNCIQLIDYMKTNRNTENEDSYNEDLDEIIPKILREALENFNVDQLIELLLHVIRYFDKDSSLFESEEFDQKCISFLNKSTECIETKTFLKLCFENPTAVWEKVFNYACTSQQQANNFCKLATGIRKLSKIFLQDLLDSSFPDKSEEKFYPNLLFEIHESEIIAKDSFFKNFIYKHVNEMLNTQNILPILSLVKALNLIVHKTKALQPFGGVTAPVLVMIAQIMDQCRWDLISYTDIKDEIVRLSIDCIQNTNKSFLPIVTEKVKEWIIAKIKEYKPLTQYYFQKYSLSVDEQPKHLDEFLRSEPFINVDSIEEFLIMNYVRCTMKETEWLARSDVLRPNISNVLLLLESLISDMGEKALPNFRHCIMNYGNLVKKIILPETDKDSEKVIQMGLIILKIIKNCPEQLYNEIFMNFHTILLDVFEKAIPLDDDVIISIKEFTATMPSCQGKELFEQKFDECYIKNST